MKSCPYTFYHNKEEGFRQKIPVIHWETLTFFTFQIDPLWGGSQGVKATNKEVFPSLLNHGVFVHIWCAPIMWTCFLIMLCTIAVSTKDVHLLLNHGVHAVPPTWHHPPWKRPLSPPLPSLSQVSNLKLANFKLGSGQLANHFQPPDRSPETTSDFTPRKIRLQNPLLTSQMRRTANPGDPV